MAKAKNPEAEAEVQAKEVGIANELKRQRDMLKEAVEEARAALPNVRVAESILTRVLGAL